MGVQPAALQWLPGIQFRIYGSSNWDSFWDLKGNILNFILSGLHNPSASRGPITDYVMVKCNLQLLAVGMSALSLTSADLVLVSKQFPDKVWFRHTEMKNETYLGDYVAAFTSSLI